MKVIVIFIIVAPGLSFQHSQCDTCSDESNESGVYNTGHSALYHRGGGSKHKHKTHSGIKLHPASETFNNVLRKGKKKDCICDCRKCEKLPKCCRPACTNECDQTEENNSVESDPGLSSGNLVFVPYPYPLVVPPPPPPMPPPGMPPFPMPMPPLNATTRTRHYDFTRRQSDLKDEAILDLLQSLRRRQEPPYVNLRPLKGRQIADNEEIDDQLLDQLIRLRNVKNINS